MERITLSGLTGHVNEDMMNDNEDGLIDVQNLTMAVPEARSELMMVGTMTDSSWYRTPSDETNGRATGPPYQGEG